MASQTVTGNIRKSSENLMNIPADCKAGTAERSQLPIDCDVNEQNTLGSRYGMLAYLFGFSGYKEMLLEKCLPTETKVKISKA